MERVYRAQFEKESVEVRVPEGNIEAVLEKHDVPALGDPAGTLRDALKNPVGCEPLSSLVKPGLRVCLLSGYYGYTSWVGPVLLDELNKAGVRDRDVTLLISVGTHVHPPKEQAKKALGPVMSRVGRTVPFDFQAQEDLAYVGVTGHGNPTWVSREMTEADVNIGLGDIMPGWYGYRGGAKTVSPGVAGRDTIWYNHRLVMSPGVAPGVAEGNAVMEDWQGSADLAGLDMKVDLVMNRDGECAGVFAGDHAAAQTKALGLVDAVWATRMRRKADITVLFREGLFRTLFSALYASSLCAELATREDGVIILVASCHAGYGGEKGGPSSGLDRELVELARLRTEALAERLVQWKCNVRTGALIYPHRRLLDEKRVFLVNEGMSQEEAAEYGVAYATGSFDKALQKALQEKGRDASICMMPNVKWTEIPRFQS